MFLLVTDEEPMLRVVKEVPTEHTGAIIQQVVEDIILSGGVQFIYPEGVGSSSLSPPKAFQGS